MTFGTFGTYEAPAKSNPFDETMRAFAEASDKDPKTSWTITIPAAEENVKRIQISQAANAIGKTASLKTRDDSKRVVIGTRAKSGNPVYSGEVTLTFILVNQHAQRRGKGTDAVESAEAVEIPADEATAVADSKASKK